MLCCVVLRNEEKQILRKNTKVVETSLQHLRKQPYKVVFYVKHAAKTF